MIVTGWRVNWFLCRHFQIDKSHKATLNSISITDHFSAVA